MNGHSITVWLEQVKQGNDEGARQLWDRYFPDLVRLAHRTLGSIPRRMEDEEDVALSAIDSFCRAADQGRFPNLNDREGLWRLLSRITHRKAVDLIRRSQTKFGDANVRRLESTSTGGGPAMHTVQAPGLSDEVALVFADQLRHLLEMLPDEQLRTIAVMKLEGRHNKEIATRLHCALRTVERRLKYLRAIWKDEMEGLD